MRGEPMHEDRRSGDDRGGFGQDGIATRGYGGGRDGFQGQGSEGRGFEGRGFEGRGFEGRGFEGRGGYEPGQRGGYGGATYGGMMQGPRGGYESQGAYGPYGGYAPQGGYASRGFEPQGGYGFQSGYGPQGGQLSRGGFAREELEARGQPGGGQRGAYRERRDSDEVSGKYAGAPIVKVIEVVAQSPRGWEDAVEHALYEASKTVRNIKSVYVKDMQAIVSDDRVVQYRLVAKISFALETSHRSEGRGYAQYD